MSKNLQHFVNNFVTGMELGNRMQDRWANQQHRKDMLAVSKSNAELAARRHAERMALDTQKLGIYKTGVDARAARDMAAAAKAGRGGAGGAPGMTPEQEEWYRAGGLTPTLPSAAPQVNVTTEDNTPVEQPGSTGLNETDEPIGAARGGRMPPPRMDAGTSGPGSGMGAIATKPPQYRDGGSVRQNDEHARYLLDKRVRDAEGEQFDDDVQRGPPYTSRGFAIGNNERRIERARPKFAGGGRVPIYGEDGSVVGYQEEPAPRIGGNRFGGNTYGGQKHGGQQFGGWTPDQGYPAPPEPAPAPAPAPNDDLERQRLNEYWRANTPTHGRTTSTQYGPGGGADVDPGLPRDVEVAPPAAGGAPEPFQHHPDDTHPPSGGGEEPAGGPQGTGRSRGGGGGRRGAIETGWKRLRDQTREAAFDPAERDRFDPDNVHAVDQNGAALSAATGYADRVFHQGKEQGKLQGQQTGGEGAPMDPRTERGKHALYGGAGAADPKLMEQIFQKVDPENRMSMDQKMMAAVKNVNDFYMGQGDKENAAKSAFEVSQFAVQMSKQHGAEAIKQMQAGNMQGALDTMIKGYNFLPDGNTASVQGNNLVITSEGGQQVASYALDERGIKNIALGMATGQLGWDVIRMGAQGGAGAPPAGGPPPAAAPPPVQQAQVAAQPSAAPAGPSQTPAAASPPPAPGATVAPAAPSATRASPPAPSGSAPARPPAPTPAGTSAPSAAARPAGGTTAIKAQPPLPAQGDNIPGSAVADPQQQMQEHFKKDPYAPLPENDGSATAEQVRKQVAEAEARHNAERAAYILRGKQIGIKSADLTRMTNHLDKQFHDQKKAIEARLETHRKESREDRKGAADRIKPRPLQRGDEEAAAEVITKRFGEIIADAGRPVRSGGDEEKKAAERKAVHGTTVLRYAKDPRDIEPLVAVARGVWRNNPDVTEADAADIARGVTAIVPKDAGRNRQVGAGATRFVPTANARGEVTLRLPDGRSIHVDNNTYARIKDLHQQNWKEFAARTADATKQGKQDEGAKQGIRMLVPKFIGPIGLGAASGR